MQPKRASNERSPSTTSEWQWVKIRKRPAAPSVTVRAKRGASRLSPWNRRTPLTVTVSFRGGAEAWIELKARGRALHVPGHVCLYDALELLWQSGY